MLAAAVARYHENRLEAAESLLESVVLLEPENDEAMLWLGETMVRLRVPASARTLARRVLDRRPCSSWAHTIVAEASSPQYMDWRGANYDTVWVHLRAATRCDSTDGNAWLGTVFAAARRGDSALYTSSLQRLVSTGFLTSSAFAYQRWLLRQLPDSAMLITAGDLDAYPALALQATEGLRPDVIVIATPLLNEPWYVRRLRDQGHLLFPLPEDLPLDSLRDAYRPFMDTTAHRAVYLSDFILAVWRRAEMHGALPRRVVIAASVGDSALHNVRGGGAFALAGGYYIPIHSADTSAVDTARLRRNLGAVDGRALGGPVTTPADRGSILSALQPGEWARVVKWAWFKYIVRLGETGRSADARVALRDLKALVEAAALRDESTRVDIEGLRTWLSQLR
jgi:hypothetical protein